MRTYSAARAASAVRAVARGRCTRREDTSQIMCLKLLLKDSRKATANFDRDFKVLCN